MAKSSKEQIEQDEIKVLDALEQHSKDKLDVIAKHCGLSRQKVSRIIKNLEGNKVIWGYPPVTDNNGGDFKHFVFMIERNTVPFDDTFRQEVIFKKIDEYAPNSVKIENIYFTYGKYNAVITFYAPNIINAKKFVDEVFKRIGKYLGEHQLLETLFPVRKQGIKNPQIKNLTEYL